MNTASAMKDIRVTSISFGVLITLLLASIIFLSFSVFASETGRQLYLESPAHGSAYTGIRTVRGWGVGVTGPVTVYLDDEPIAEALLGGTRNDVVEVFGEGASGFSLAVNFNKFPVGPHRLKVTAEDLSDEAAIYVNSFPVEFVPYAPDLSRATVLGGFDITVLGAYFPGIGVIDFVIGWSQEDNNMVITDLAIADSEPQEGQPDNCSFSPPCLP